MRLGPAERAAGGMAARLRSLLLGARVLCRALEAGSPPAVELFVRTGPQNILASVNNAILMEYDFLQQCVPPRTDICISRATYLPPYAYRLRARALLCIPLELSLIFIYLQTFFFSINSFKTNAFRKKIYFHLI